MEGLKPLAGVHGSIEAHFEAAGRAVVGTRAPLELRGPFAGTTMPLYYLRNVATGVFAGDCYDVSLRAGEGASVQVASSSATKAFPGATACATLNTELDAARDSRLVWGPHPLILQAGSSLRQRTRVRIEDGAFVILADVLSFGRSARGERLRFDRFESELVVERAACGPIYEERYVLEPDATLEASVGGYNGLATIYLLGDVPIAGDGLANALEAAPGFGGWSALPNEAGIVAKLLVRSLSDGLSFCQAVIAAATTSSAPAEVPV